MSATFAAPQMLAATTQRALFPATATGFFFAFRVFIILLAVRVLFFDAQTGAALSLALNYLLFIGIAFVSSNRSHVNPPLLRSKSFHWVLIFLALSLASLSWTAAVSLSAAFAFWVAMAADTFIVVLLLRTHPAEDVAASLIRGYIVGAMVMAAIAWIMPAQSDLRLGDEELLGPNQIGYVCALAVFLAQYLVARGHRHWRIPAILLAVTLLRTFSKTTIIAFAAGQLLLLFRNRSISRKQKVYFFACTAAVLACFWPLISNYYEVYTHAGNQAETLTGRLGIWAFILDRALDTPWIGHGFHSVWKVIPAFGPFEARHAHNEVLQQFYAYGVAGLILLAGVYGSFFKQVRHAVKSPLKSLGLALLIFAVIRGLADTEVFDLSLPLWLITLLGAAILALPAESGAPA